MTDPVVTHEPELRRFAVRSDGELAGFAEYVRKGGRYFFVHTEVDPRFGGRGVGSALARGAMEQMEGIGEPVVPLCPFIAGWIERHPEYDHLVDHQLLDHLNSGR